MTTIDEYVGSKFSPDQRPLAEAARDLVRESLPDAAEAIKWGHPVWEIGGRPVSILRATKAYVTFGFAVGPDYIDPHGRLEGTGSAMKHVKLTRPEDIDADAFRDYLAQVAKAAAV
ncbi:DUF1801 domain-containing protein [bacterium]|nr:MAG: DUF1801 domain-containing protein [bacterium]